MDASKSKLSEFLENRKSKIGLILAAYVIALVVMVVLIYNRWSASDIAVAVVMFPLGLSIFLAPVFGKLWELLPGDGKTIAAALTSYLIYIGLAVAMVRTRNWRIMGILYIIFIILLIANVSSCVSGMTAY
jgi:hypothetical protein